LPSSGLSIAAQEQQGVERTDTIIPSPLPPPYLHAHAPPGNSSSVRCRGGAPLQYLFPAAAGPSRVAAGDCIVQGACIQTFTQTHPPQSRQSSQLLTLPTTLRQEFYGVDSQRREPREACYYIRSHAWLCFNLQQIVNLNSAGELQKHR
jgi:hypothetical protein